MSCVFFFFSRDSFVVHLKVQSSLTSILGASFCNFYPGMSSIFLLNCLLFPCHKSAVRGQQINYADHIISNGTEHLRKFQRLAARNVSNSCMNVASF